MNSLIARPEEDTQLQSSSEIGGAAEELENVENSGTPNSKSGDSKSDWKKRYLDLQSFHDRTIAQMEKKMKAEAFVAPSTPEEVEAFKKKHKDVYNIIRTLAYEEVQAGTGDLKEQVGEVVKKTSEGAQKSAAKAILKAHPDFNDIKKSSQFHEWASDQTPEIQNWIYKNPDNAQLAIKAINLFKVETAYKNEASSQASDDSAAEAVKSNSQPQVKGGQKIWKASEIKSLHPSQYAKLEKEIDKAVEEGRVDFNS